MDISNLKKNSFRVWILAMRLYSIPLSITPVIAASILAYKLNSFNIFPALCCLVFAVLMHIVVNLSNDYYDLKKGSDTVDNSLFARLVFAKLLDEYKILIVTGIICFSACLIGLLLIPHGGWWLIIIGLLCVMGAYGYTGGPFPFAYNAFGDIIVFIFFGLIVTVFSFYVQALEFHYTAWTLGAIFGLTSMNVLITNNIRDFEADKAIGKITTIVLLGPKFGRFFYLINGLIAAALCLIFLKEGWTSAAVLPQLYLILHLKTWKKLCDSTGKELNVVIKQTVLNVIILGGLISVGLLLY